MISHFLLSDFVAGYIAGGLVLASERWKATGWRRVFYLIALVIGFWFACQALGIGAKRVGL